MKVFYGYVGVWNIAGVKAFEVSTYDSCGRCFVLDLHWSWLHCPRMARVQLHAECSRAMTRRMAMAMSARYNCFARLFTLTLVLFVSTGERLGARLWLWS